MAGKGLGTYGTQLQAFLDRSLALRDDDWSRVDERYAASLACFGHVGVEELMDEIDLVFGDDPESFVEDAVRHIADSIRGLDNARQALIIPAALAVAGFEAVPLLLFEAAYGPFSEVIPPESLPGSPPLPSVKLTYTLAERFVSRAARLDAHWLSALRIWEMAYDAIGERAIAAAIKAADSALPGRDVALQERLFLAVAETARAAFTTAAIVREVAEEEIELTDDDVEPEQVDDLDHECDQPDSLPALAGPRTRAWQLRQGLQLIWPRMPSGRSCAGRA
ncbi:MAG TPA: hypothetical protein VNN10_05340 [Dehalococcoidia bacterium]|nr:hypothetical protein [Dehalococcoidia bacterium]